MVVVAHQAKRVHGPPEAFGGLVEQAEEEPAILVVEEDHAAGDATAVHVVDPVGEH